MGEHMLNVHDQIGMGENHFPSEAYTSMFKVYGSGSC